MVDGVAVCSPTIDAAEPQDDEQIIPLHSEQIDVAVGRVVIGEVQVSTVTHLRDIAIDEALISQHANIERIAIGHVVETAPDVREEDGVLIIPILEEIVVVERRLVLKEEVRIRRSTSTHQHQETVTVREQEAVVTRTHAASASGAIPPNIVSVTQEETIP